MDLCKVNFCIRNLFIQCKTGRCYADITDGVSIYLYVRVIVLVHVYPMCVCLCLRYQIRVIAKTMLFL